MVCFVNEVFHAGMVAQWHSMVHHCLRKFPCMCSEKLWTRKIHPIDQLTAWKFSRLAPGSLRAQDKNTFPCSWLVIWSKTFGKTACRTDPLTASETLCAHPMHDNFKGLCQNALHNSFRKILFNNIVLLTVQRSHHKIKTHPQFQCFYVFLLCILFIVTAVIHLCRALSGA